MISADGVNFVILNQCTDYRG